MIATDRFVFIHLHKSGGTFVNECLMRFFPNAQQLGYHLPLRCIPEPLRQLPVLGFVRNPWSYYVSWYEFQSRKATPNALFRCASDNRNLDFAGTIDNLLHLGDNAIMLDDLLQRLPTGYGDQGLNLPASALAPIRGTGMGFYSYLYRYMYSGSQSKPFVGRMETLRTDLLAFLAESGERVTPELRRFIQQEPPRNRSVHGDYRDYYNKRLAAQVAQCDHEVIEEFGYRFDD